jgi:uncharacterized protein (TIGR03435 family)
MIRLGLILVGPALAALPLAAQQGPPRFEVTSVKIIRSALPDGTVDLRPDQFTATNTTLRELIAAANNVKGTFRVVGGPPWVDSDRFDVQGRASAPVRPDVAMATTMAMMRTLLADRFGLRTRLARQGRPILALTTTDSGGRTGPRLRPASSAACIERGMLPGEVPAGELPSCGLSAGPGRISGLSVGLYLLADYLSPRVNRLVTDRTGLSGTFDFDLEWEMEDAAQASLRRLSPDGTPPPEFDGAPMVKALREQLGLRLEATTGPVPVIVIDSVERPTLD